MPRRRRLLTPMKRKVIINKLRYDDYEKEGNEISTPRGRLKGALKEALEPGGDESDTSIEKSPMKKERYTTQETRRERKYNFKHDFESSDEDDDNSRKQSPQRYVLKLFDRSVDLSQFDEDSPLYPICRAWIANQPKMNYKKFGKKYKLADMNDDSVELPGPEGPPISRIPALLPEQKAVSKDNINLNYREAPPPARESLLAEHCARWAAVRQAWVDQSVKVEARYEATQQLLNKINVSAV